MFDLDGDGCIDANDLRGTFGTLGEGEVPDGLVEQMLSEVELHAVVAHNHRFILFHDNTYCRQ